MPALIVSQVISSAFGFSRNRWMLPSRVGFDQPVRASGLSTGVSTIVALRLALAVQRDHGAEIDLRQHVAVEHDDRFAQRLAGVADGAGRAERRRLDDVADAEPGCRCRRRRSPRSGAAGS